VYVLFTDATNCEDVYARGMTSNGTYRVFNDDGTSYQVACQFNPDRTGLAFPTKHAISSGRVNFDALWTNRTYVGIYLWFADRRQYEAIIRPLANEESTTVLKVNTSWQETLPSVDPSAGPYIYVTIANRQSTTATSAPFTVTPGNEGTNESNKQTIYFRVSPHSALHRQNWG